MTHKLNVLERLVTLGILPKEGDFTTLKIVRDLQNVLSLSEEEHKEFEVKVLATGGHKWNKKGEEDRELEIGEKAFDIIKGAFETLDKERKLMAHHLSAYEKFVLEKNNQ